MHGSQLHSQLATDLQERDTVDDSGDDLRMETSTNQATFIDTNTVDTRAEQVILVSKAVEVQLRMLCANLDGLQKLAIIANLNKHLTRTRALSAQAQTHIAVLRNTSGKVSIDFCIRPV